MKKIKIAQVITRMDWGGSPDIVRILCNRLNPDISSPTRAWVRVPRQGLDIYDIKLIYGLTLHPSRETKLFLEKFKDNSLCIKYLKRKINIFNDCLVLFKLFQLFKKEKFDIVHTHTAKAGVLGRIAGRFSGVPIIIHTPHGHNFYGYFGPIGSKLVVILEKFMAYITSRIIALTELEKEDLIKFKITKPKRIMVINSGLELDNYRKIDIDREGGEFKIGKDTFLVGMISRFEYVKGPEYFVEAAKVVTEKIKNIKFLAVGDGTLRKKIEYRTKELNISSKFIFTGWREDIPQILSILDILVLPSLNEAVGRILIEAGACGLPVVATSVGGIPEIVKDNETGILVPPKDPNRLARGIIELLEDREKRLRMGDAGRDWVDDKFSAQRMIDRISFLYSDIIKCTPQRSGGGHFIK